MQIVRTIVGGLTLASVLALTAASANAGQIILGGSAQSGLSQALNNLGLTYTTTSQETPNASGLGAGDTIVIGMDGGTQTFYDYTTFLNAGGRVIVAGGSNYEPYRQWAALYFNLTDTASGWHTDGAWHTTAAIPASAGLPANYVFNTGSATYHMLGFLPTPDTILYGQNDEGVSVAAFRSYANGGVFDYLALDVSNYVNVNDLANFTTPWLNNALNAPAYPIASSVPDGGVGSLFAASTLVGLIAAARRKQAVK